MKLVLYLIALALLAAGPAVLLAPDAASTAFGIPVDSPSARTYLMAAATRDFAMGAWLLALVWLRVRRRVLAISMLAIALVAAGDAANVLVKGRGDRAMALTLHIGGFVALLIIGCRLWLSPDDEMGSHRARVIPG